MKKFLALILIAATTVVYGAAYLPQPIVKTVASTSVPEALGAETVEFESVIFIGYKTSRTANTGRVWIQQTTTNDAPGVPIVSGGTASFTAPPGKAFTANSFYIDVENAGDGVVAIFTK